ncbi:MAG: divalent-cation tolerance protein CutA [Steroidobacteraceae bacterium]
MNLPAVADHPAILVLCTCPDESVALDIARELVTQGLAACVNRLACVRSIYRWAGRICEESEQLLLIKTTPARYEALEMRLKALHPFETPEIIAIPVMAGSHQYLAWLATATNPMSVPPT